MSRSCSPVRPGIEGGDLFLSFSYNRKILFRARAAVELAGEAELLLEMLESAPPEPADLSTFRRAAETEEVERILGARDPERALGELPRISVEMAVGLTWRARVLSTSATSDAHLLCDLAQKACDGLPSAIGGWLGPDLLAILEAARANVFRREERFVESEEAFCRAYELHRKGSCQPALLADYLSLWGSLLLDTGELGRADVAISIAYVLAESDPDCRGKVACKAGIIQGLLGNPQRAGEFFLEAESLVADQDYLRFLRINRALVSAQVGSAEEARRLLEEFEHQPSDSEFLQALVLRIRGLIHRALGEADQAVDLLTLSAAAFEKCGDSQGFALSTLDVARLLLDKGEFERVATLAKGSFDVLSSLGVRGQALVAWMTFRQAAEAESLRSSAVDTFRNRFLELLLKTRFQAVD